MEYEETRRMDPAETENPNKMMTTKEYEETSCVICQNGCRSSGTVWLIKVFQNTKTVPVYPHEFPASKSGIG